MHCRVEGGDGRALSRRRCGLGPSSRMRVHGFADPASPYQMRLLLHRLVSHSALRRDARACAAAPTARCCPLQRLPPFREPGTTFTVTPDNRVAVLAEAVAAAAAAAGGAGAVKKREETVSRLRPTTQPNAAAATE